MYLQSVQPTKVHSGEVIFTKTPQISKTPKTSKNPETSKNPKTTKSPKSAHVPPEAKTAKKLEVSGWPWAKTTAEMFTAPRCQKLANL